MHSRWCGTTREETGTYDEGFADAVALIASRMDALRLAELLRALDPAEAARVLTVLVPTLQ